VSRKNKKYIPPGEYIGRCVHFPNQAKMFLHLLSLKLKMKN